MRFFRTVAVPGRNRAEACLAKLQELNSSVSEPWLGLCLEENVEAAVSDKNVSAAGLGGTSETFRSKRRNAIKPPLCESTRILAVRLVILLCSQVAVKVKTEKLTPDSLAGFSMVVMVDATLEDCIA